MLPAVLRAFLPTTLLLLAAALVSRPAVAPPVVTFTDLHDFNSNAGDPFNFQVARLAQGRDGNLYAESGSPGDGTVSMFTPSGGVSIVHNFTQTDGQDAAGGMTLGLDGNLYGDTTFGGTSNAGVTFKVSPGGVETVLHNFAGTDGDAPANALVLGTDGNFYGTTTTIASIYRVSPTGKFQSLHLLSSSDGSIAGQLSQGSDGNFYGGAVYGGASGYGTLFKVTPTGAFTVLHNFDGADGYGGSPGMVQAPNGLFYGTTSLGGDNNYGVVYKMSSTGAYTVLHSLNGTSDGSVGLPLMLATDGNFYGEAQQGGSTGCGTVFKVTPAGVFSTLYNFDNTHGCTPSGYLTEGTSGLLYGLTDLGGANTNGVFFSLDVGLKPFISPMPMRGRVGSKIGILGQGFSKSSVVSFNGVPATSVTLSGTTFLTATVPAGASDGYVTVKTGTTTLKSSQKFIVPDSWGQGATIPTPVAFASASVLNNQIYLVGGYSGSTYSGPVANNQIYNPTTNSWTSGTPLSAGVAQAAAATVNNVLYVFGGTPDGVNDSNAVWAYNPATNTWSAKTAMPTARRSIAAAVDNNIIYVIGGYSTSGGRLNTVEAYNPATDSWTTESPLLTGESEPSASLVASTIIAADGSNGVSANGDNEGYNSAMNTWTSLTSDPNPRSAACGGGIAGRMYIAGGFPNQGNNSTLNEAFSLSSNSWTMLAPLPQSTALAAASVYKGQLYCLGGWATGNGGAPPISNVQIYQP